MEVKQHTALGVVRASDQEFRGGGIDAYLKAVGFEECSRGVPDSFIIVHHMNDGCLGIIQL